MSGWSPAPARSTWASAGGSGRSAPSWSTWPPHARWSSTSSPSPTWAGPHARWPTSSGCWNAATTWSWPPISPPLAVGWAWSPRRWRRSDSPGQSGSTSGWSAGRSRTSWRRSCSPSRPVGPASGLPTMGRSGPTCGSWGSAGVSWLRGAGSRRSRPRWRRSRPKPNGARERRGRPARQPRPTAPSNRLIAATAAGHRIDWVTASLDWSGCIGHRPPRTGPHPGGVRAAGRRTAAHPERGSPSIGEGGLRS